LPKRLVIFLPNQPPSVEVPNFHKSLHQIEAFLRPTLPSWLLPIKFEKIIFIKNRTHILPNNSF
jgi:hypothetical protein